MNRIEARIALETKGWSIALLAKRWGVSCRTVHRKINQEVTPAYVEDVIKGLPSLGKPTPPRQRFLSLKPNSQSQGHEPKTTDEKVSLEAAADAVLGLPELVKPVIDSTAEHYAPSTLVCLEKSISETLDEGARGVVYRVSGAAQDLNVFVLFEGADATSFTLREAVSILGTPGLTCGSIPAAGCTLQEALALLKYGEIDFWPELQFRLLG